MRRITFCVSVSLALLLVPGATFAGEDECEATIDGTLMREEKDDTKTTYTGKVDISVDAMCAVVKFALVVVEEDPDGEQKEVRKSKQVKIRDSTEVSLKMDYKKKRESTVVSHRFEQTSCTLCE